MIIPITGKISLKNPPIITISLILINCLVFFIFQFNDTKEAEKAIHYYYQSGLAEIETRHYIAYAEAGAFDEAKQYDIEIPADPDAALNARQINYVLGVMQSDAEFMADLEAEKIISPGDPEYADWKKQRQAFKQRLARTTTHRYGFIPAEASPITMITHMFLHGGFGHLLGNMIFLWLVGCILEVGCGRHWYTAWYIIGGIGAVSLFWAVNADSSQPLIGASGAISGLMGLMTVLYGFKKIKVFLSLGFYFNYFKMWGILLLPVWIGKELYSWAMYSDVSNVAFMAHAGGLAAGAVLGVLNLHVIGLYNKTVFEEEPEDTDSPLLDCALQAIEDIDFDNARRYLNDFLNRQPRHVAALTHLFNIEKLDPDHDRFHDAARHLLSELASRPDSHEKAKKIYAEYQSLTARPKLPPEIFLKISSVLLSTGEIETAEKMLRFLMKKRPQLAGLAPALLRLATAFRENGDTEKSNACADMIRTRFPASPEANIVSTW